MITDRLKHDFCQEVRTNDQRVVGLVQPKAVLKQSRDVLCPIFYFCGIVAFKILIDCLMKQLEPLFEMSRVDFERYVLLKGIALIRILTKNHRSPKVVHRGHVLRPIEISKNWREQFVSSYFFIECINEMNDVVPGFDVFH